MSVRNTRRGSHGQQPQFAVKPVYKPFEPFPEGADELEAVRLHMRWLLGNMDFFALEGPQSLHIAHQALQRDLGILGYGVIPKLDVETLAAKFCPPEAREIAAELAKLEQRHGALREQLSMVDQLMNDWPHRDLVGDDVWRKSHQDARYWLTQARKKL